MSCQDGSDRIDLQRISPNFAASIRRQSVLLGVPKDRIEDFLQLAVDQLSQSIRPKNRLNGLTMYDVMRRASLLAETEYS